MTVQHCTKHHGIKTVMNYAPISLLGLPKFNTIALKSMFKAYSFRLDQFPVVQGGLELT